MVLWCMGLEEMTSSQPLAMEPVATTCSVGLVTTHSSAVIRVTCSLAVQVMTRSSPPSAMIVSTGAMATTP